VLEQAVTDMQNDLVKIRQNYAEISAAQKRMEKQKNEAETLAGDWYKRAHDFATEIGKGDVRRGAGAIAILSSQVGWNDNQRMARQLRDTGTASGGFVTGRQVTQARSVLEGSAQPEQHLPMDRKTGNFFKNIVNPDDPEAVTVDRHAHDITVGRVLGSADRGLQTPTRYNTFSEAHRNAAGNLGMLPSQAQAVGWVNWRRQRGIVD
jgi:hypothetical protein